MILPLMILMILLLVQLITILLAVVTIMKQRLRVSKTQKTLKPNEKESKQSAKKENHFWSEYTTALYSGRVSHIRYHPAIHSFSYPLFFFCLDLKEVDGLFLSNNASLWPLSLFMQFRPEDHLKNEEGLKLSDAANMSMCGELDKIDLSTRIRNLIFERTNGKYKPSSDQTILLVTHLSYYGYCFNPVSFYYIMSPDYSFSTSKSINEKKDHIEAIVAEVSNTPWNEMQCYVLHPESKDVMEVQKQSSKIHLKKNEDQAQEKLSTSKGVDDKWDFTNYIFQKTFHVSPFMDMEHKYDWTFYSLSQNNQIKVSTSMLKGDTKYFNAHFQISRTSITPFTLCKFLLRLPVYCFIIQIWIHIEAFKLFMKGVEFIPHPEGSETSASNIIAFFMTPFFALKDWWQGANEDTEMDKNKVE